MLGKGEPKVLCGDSGNREPKVPAMEIYLCLPRLYKKQVTLRPVSGVGSDMHFVCGLDVPRREINDCRIPNHKQQSRQIRLH